MVWTGVYFEAGLHVGHPQLVAFEHPQYGFAQHLRWIALEHPIGWSFLESTGIPRVPPIQLILPLVAGEVNLPDGTEKHQNFESRRKQVEFTS